MADSARIDELRRRVQLDPASIAFAALAEEYRRSGRFHDAVSACQAGLQRHPAYLSARVTLGRALLEIGEYDQAADELQRVLRLAPENLAAIRAFADIHERRRQLPSRLESDQDRIDDADVSAAPMAVKVSAIAVEGHTPQDGGPALSLIEAAVPSIPTSDTRPDSPSVPTAAAPAARALEGVVTVPTVGPVPSALPESAAYAVSPTPIDPAVAASRF